MDGQTAQSLREKGSSETVVWGITRNHLKEIAGEYKPDSELARGLWRCNVRECKLLATMLMPVPDADEETMDAWIGEIKTGELAEMIVFNLLQHLPYASRLADKYLQSEADTYKLIALSLYSRLFMKGNVPDEGIAEKFLKEAVAALESENLSVRRAAMNSLIHFAGLGAEYGEKAALATKAAGFDFI